MLLEHFHSILSQTSLTVPLLSLNKPERKENYTLVHIN